MDRVVSGHAASGTTCQTTRDPPAISYFLAFSLCSFRASFSYWLKPLPVASISTPISLPFLLIVASKLAPSFPNGRWFRLLLLLGQPAATAAGTSETVDRLFFVFFFLRLLSNTPNAKPALIAAL